MKTFSISGGIAGPPSACSSAPNRIDVFAVKPGSRVWRESGDGANWQNAVELPNISGVSIPAGGLCAISSAPGRVEAFAVTDSAIPVWWRGNNEQWSVGASFPKGSRLHPFPLAAVAASSNDIDVFAVDHNTLIWRWHWNGSSWNIAEQLPGRNGVPNQRIAAIAAAPGRLDVFAVGSNGRLWHWSKAGLLPWVFQDRGGNLYANGVSAVSWGPNRLDVFAASREPGNPLQHWWANGDRFEGPETEPFKAGNVAPGTVSAVSSAPNKLDVFAITGSQQLAHWAWDEMGWTGPNLRGEGIPAGDVSAVVRAPRRLDVFVTGAGNTLRQWPGGGIENARSRTWENWPTTFQKATPPGILKPDSLEELVNIVRQAQQSNLGVRAVGTGWSSSDVAISSGFVVETDLLGAVLTNVLTTSLNPEGAGMRLLHVEAGMKLDKLVAILRSRELELKTLGGSTGQSLAGALSTSVHGMDPTVGPLPDMVRAIHLVGPGGIQHWIEPSSQIITDRTALGAALRLADENIHYDDDWFNSALVSMGSLGIIYSLVIELDDEYDLVETRERSDWPTVRAQLLANDENNPLNTNRQGVQVVITPYASGDETPGDTTRNCYLTTRRRDIATDVKPPGADPAWFIRDITPILFSTWRADRRSVDEFTISATDRAQAPGTWRGLAHSHSGGSDPGGVRGIGLEVIFDASTTAYLEFVDEALEIIRAAYRDSEPKPWSYLGWISLRFQGRSVAYLSPQHEAALSCSVEFAAAYRRPELPGIGWDDTPKLLLLIEQAGRKRGGIQHWGMNAAINALDVERAYPRLDTWRRVRWELTRGGTISTFDSDFTHRCGLSAPPFFVRNANYNAGGRTDAAVWRPGTGTWSIYSSSGGEFVEQWGQVGDIPVPGDYDGDGTPNLAVWRPSTGTWFIIEPNRASGVSLPGGRSPTIPRPPGDRIQTRRERSQRWGLPGDIPVPGDYSGDGRTDFAVWRPSTGEWLIKDSVSGAEHSQQWGLPGDVPVPGDYSGDGRTDFAVWRPSTGVWGIKDRATGVERSQQWGDSRDIPVPRDYTGDGRVDFAVWRPSTGVWWIKDNATGAERGLLYGKFGDVPV
jgi:hypothetical protein